MAFLDNINSWEWWLVIVISILVTTLVLYLSMRFICGRKRLDAGYFFRLFIVSIILIVGVVAIAELLNFLVNLGGAFQYNFAPMFYVFITIGFIIVIRYLLTVPSVIPYKDYSSDKYWQWSIWITIISLFMIFLIAFLVYIISNAFGHPIYLLTP